MNYILPKVLKSLREERRWSLDDLAKKTGMNRQTIHRLEQEDGNQKPRRKRTIDQLARALKVDPGVLTGQIEPPDTDSDAGYFLMSKLGFRVSVSAQNALFLASTRYNVSQQDIVELAPLLYVWAAEASLQRRRMRLGEAKQAFIKLKSAEENMRHLPESDFTHAEEKFAVEQLSIEGNDLFGIYLDDNVGYPDATYEEGSENPFATFLIDLTRDASPAASMNGYASYDYPDYQVCPEEAESLANGDQTLKEAILSGYVSLNDMPKDIRKPEMVNERTDWLRARFDELQLQLTGRVDERRLGGSK